MSPSPRCIRGFTVVEVTLVLAILLTLFILGMAVQQRMVAMGKNARCVNNLAQISALFQGYLVDHRYTYPRAFQTPYRFWPQDLVEHSGNPAALQAFICPGVRDLSTSLKELKGGYPYISYGINRYGVAPMAGDATLHPAVQTRIQEPSKLMLLLDFETANQPWEGWYNADALAIKPNWEAISKRHRNVNALFCDGHVAAVTLAELTRTPTTDMPWGTYQYTRDR